MKFTVVMASYLGQYRHSAQNRDEKIVRAIDSVVNQTFQDWELLVVADGCEKTAEIVKKVKDPRVRGLYIHKQPMFSGTPRNVGIKYAKGEWIVYLDVDDKYGSNHLRIISDQMTDKDWYWFNDRSYNKATGVFDILVADINKRGRCGTSNICHRQDLEAWWSEKATYLHDYLFIVDLKAVSQNYGFMENTPEYLICHVPRLLDV